MKQLEAMRATLQGALLREYDNVVMEEKGVDYAHLESMLQRVEAEPHKFSDAKLGRWLGYMQGVLVANGLATLEEMKQLNVEFRDDSDEIWKHLKRGTTYAIVGEARLQYEEGHVPLDGDMLTLYRDTETGVYSVRHPDEFRDGRFVQMGPLVESGHDDPVRY